MKNNYILIIILLVLPMMISAESQATKKNIQLLEWVENADPLVDVSKAIGIMDYKFLGIVQYAVSIPGISQEKQLEMRELFGYRIIKGTSDVLDGVRYIHLLNLATKYAEIYNKELYKYLSKKFLTKK